MRKMHLFDVVRQAMVGGQDAVETFRGVVAGAIAPAEALGGSGQFAEALADLLQALGIVLRPCSGPRR